MGAKDLRSDEANDKMDLIRAGKFLLGIVYWGWTEAEA
jgi:hypothetical protein